MSQILHWIFSLSLSISSNFWSKPKHITQGHFCLHVEKISLYFSMVNASSSLSNAIHDRLVIIIRNSNIDCHEWLHQQSSRLFKNLFQGDSSGILKSHLRRIHCMSFSCLQNELTIYYWISSKGTFVTTHVKLFFYCIDILEGNFLSNYLVEKLIVEDVSLRVGNKIL